MLLFLAFSNCKKEGKIFDQPEIEPTTTIGCEDTTFFMSNVDLEPLAFLYNCYLVTATKEVPGLGSIPWTGNIFVNISEDKFQFYTGTYQDSIDWLIREDLFCGYVPISTGIHPVYDGYHYQQNIGTTFGGYARSLDDGDVADGYWNIDTTCVNYIEITQLDLQNKEVRGNFEFHLKMQTQGQAGILYSERINFINGKFKARIHEF